MTCCCLRAARQLSLLVEAADAAVDAGMFEVRQRWAFRHPLVRSAAYRSASEGERRRAHGPLAEVTDADLDADRKAWHRAQATAVPDEEVAAALERTAARAKARGGLAAAGGFLERAAQLTPDAGRRVERALAAAAVLREAGAFESVENLRRAIEAAQLTDLQAARARCLHAEVNLARGEGDPSQAILQLLGAADRLKHLDPVLGQAAHLQTLWWGFTRGPDVVSALALALDSAPSSDQPTPVELMLRGYGQLFAEGYPAGTDLLRSAMVALRDAQDVQESHLYILEMSETIAEALCDLASGEVLARRGVELARRVGALSTLPRQLMASAQWKVYAGEFRAAEALFAEADAVGEAIGQPGGDHAVLDAVCCDCEQALRRIDEYERHGALAAFDYHTLRATALNGAGRYEDALECAQRASDAHPAGAMGIALIELVEAAARCGEQQRARRGRAARRAHPTGRDRLGAWARGPLPCPGQRR